MELVSSRRLTGPNLFMPVAGAVVDVQASADQQPPLVNAWKHYLRRALELVGWSESEIAVRQYANGVSMMFSAPVDCLYAATDINDWAFEQAALSVQGQPAQADQTALQNLKQLVADEQNPKLLKLLESARDHGVPFLADDDHASVGHGCRSITWPTDNLPDPELVDWSRAGSIPTVIITGTNGKTTSVRLAAKILNQAGFVTGLSSTDWIAVDDRVVDRGDWSGPGGARAVLRDERVTAAILETARGGMLRRGLAVSRVDVVLITNVAADHLGEFGVETVDQLADVKWLASQAVDDNGRLVLNADDPYLLERGKQSSLPITWFSRDPGHTVFSDNTRRCTVEDGFFKFHDGSVQHRLMSIDDVPVTLRGAAVHNVSNVLGVIAICRELGIEDSAIVAGLKSFLPADNPGRCNLYEINGARILVDFAHNPHGVEAFLNIARAAPGRRNLLVIGQAGDRSDEDIRQLARSTMDIPLDRVIIKKMDKFARGRDAGETASILRQEFIHQGVAEKCLEMIDDELDSVKEAISWSREGDLLVLLIHEDRDRVLDYLDQVQAESTSSG